MNIFLYSLILFTGCLACSADKKLSKDNSSMSSHTIVVHGGAGNFRREDFSAEQIAEYKASLEKALNAGYDILENGGSAMDAVETAVRMLEDEPLFNAGRGSVLTSEATIEMDASLMDGNTLKAGSVAGVSRIKNPVLAARKVMENSSHVMLTGKGAEDFAQEQGVELVDPSYFFTQKSIDQLKRIREQEKKKEEEKQRGKEGGLREGMDYSKFGTVGAVALDKHGNIAAATSTGGMVNKRYGRVGDSPIIGAGTYANNKTCAVSSTGHGEFFMRSLVAYDISALMEYKEWNLERASEYVIREKLSTLKGTGGVITLDAQGNISMVFNTSGMFRGFRNSRELEVLIW